MRKNSTLANAISPEMKTSGQVVWGSNNWPTEINGGNENYALIKKYEIATGRFYTTQEIKSAAKVCVLGQTVVDNIFGENTDPIGQLIRF